MLVKPISENNTIIFVVVLNWPMLTAIECGYDFPHFLFFFFCLFISFGSFQFVNICIFAMYLSSGCNSCFGLPNIWHLFVVFEAQGFSGFSFLILFRRVSFSGFSFLFYCCHCCIGSYSHDTRFIR